MKSLASPTSEIPDRSPLMSAANTGTPARANPSAITCNDTVLPVPVAPVTRPCRLASASDNQAVCSPFPIKIFSSVSAVLLSEVAITSPLRAHRRSLVAKPHHHIASCPSIETVGAMITGVGLPRPASFSYFFPTVRQKKQREARKVGVDPAFTLALLQHSPRESRTAPPRRALFACISDRRRSRSIDGSDPVMPAEGGGHTWTN